MQKKISLFLMSYLLILSNAHAENWLDDCWGCEKEVYIKLCSGVSFSTEAHIHAPFPEWVRTKQGYNSRIGNRPIIGFGVGCDLGSLLSVDITLSSRPNFKYKRFQTPLADQETTFSRTRRFNLDIATLMFNFYLNGRGWDYISWKPECLCGEIYPVLGVGLGASRFTLYNFRSTGIAPLVEDQPSFLAENEYTVRNGFTYQIMAGLEYRADCWALSLGYRWFDPCKFKSSKYRRDPEGLAYQRKGWKIDVSAHELVVEAKYYL